MREPLYEIVADWERHTVCCTECETTNAECATVCVNCSVSLYGVRGDGRDYVRHVRYEKGYGFHISTRALISIAIGLIIIFSSFSLLLAEFYGIDILLKPIILFFPWSFRFDVVVSGT
jgi:hypothetical protein